MSYFLFQGNKLALLPFGNGGEEEEEEEGFLLSEGLTTSEHISGFGGEKERGRGREEEGKGR